MSIQTHTYPYTVHSISTSMYISSKKKNTSECHVMICVERHIYTNTDISTHKQRHIYTQTETYLYTISINIDIYKHKSQGHIIKCYVTSSYILCHIIIHTMSHHHTYYLQTQVSRTHHQMRATSLQLEGIMFSDHIPCKLPFCILLHSHRTKAVYIFFAIYIFSLSIYFYFCILRARQVQFLRTVCVF